MCFWGGIDHGVDDMGWSDGMKGLGRKWRQECLWQNRAKESKREEWGGLRDHGTTGLQDDGTTGQPDDGTTD
jgi:hypothetical protein